MRPSSKPYWYPDWTGLTCVIVGGGPSVANVDFDVIKDRGVKCIAINNAIAKVPWADVLYACDFNWWREYQPLWKDYVGLKITQDKKALDEFEINRVICERHHENLVVDRLGFVGWGGNSGFHCMNLCLQWKVKRIILVGYDMNLDAGSHWHGDHKNGLHNPSAANVARWRRTIDANAKIFQRLGIRVINTSPVSSLTQYPKMTLLEALND